MGYLHRPYIAGIARGMLALVAALMPAQAPLLAHAADAAGYSINIYDHVQATASSAVHNPYAGKEKCYATDVLKGTITASGCSEDPFLVDGAAIKLRDPMREGHVFKGWSIAGSPGILKQGPTVTMASVSSDVEYVANWEPSVYSVSYDAHGGEFERGVVSYAQGEDPSSLSGHREDSYSYGSQIELADPGRKGMAFSKWKVSTGGPYDIIYELDGGYFSASPKTSYRTSDAAFTLPSPSRQGYSFAGWTGSNGASPQKSVAVAKGSSGTKAYKANWTPIAYTVSYALGDGTFGGAAARTGYAAGDDFMLPKPTLRGYSFTGWTGSNGAVPETDVTIKYGPIGDRSYVANWEPIEYAITYSLGGGSLPPGATPTAYDVETPSFALPVPSRDGHRFDGWTGSNGTSPQLSVTLPDGTPGDKSYVANWTEMCSVTLSYDQSTYLDEACTALASTRTDKAIPGEKHTFPIVYKDGAGLMYWQEKTTGARTTNNELVITEDGTYEPVFEAGRITITLDPNGGALDGKTKTMQVKLGSPYGSLPIPMKEGYGFSGWHTALTGGDKVVDTNIVKISKNHTLYARWEKYDEIEAEIKQDQKIDVVFTANIQQITLPPGKYLLEAYGASGGKSGHNQTQTYGGYAGGYYTTDKEVTLYVVVGGQGTAQHSGSAVLAGGYNGAGNGAEAQEDSSGGGSATHIALVPGLLPELEDQKEKILIVGGGAGGNGCSSQPGGNGGYGNNTNGQNGVAYGSEGAYGGTLTGGGRGGTNSEAGSFGKGGSTGVSQTWPGAGGGSGYYGGGAGDNLSGGGGSGGGGSSYANPDYISNPTNTYTGGPNAGDGYAVIKCIELY